MKRARKFVAEFGAFLGITALMAVLAMGFVLPWRSEASTTGLSHYFPARDGDAWLQTETDPEGGVTWRSSNVQRVPALRALNEWRDGPRTALRDFLSGGEELSEEELIARFRSAEAIATRERTLKPDGSIGEVINYSIRDARGEWLVAFFDVVERTDTVFTPPLLSAPADLAADSKWSSEGEIGVVGYTYDAAVVDQGPHSTALGSFSDCLKMEATLRLRPPSEDEIVETSHSWFCADAQGTVDAGRSAAEGDYITVTLATDDLPAVDFPPAPAGLATDDAPVEAAEDWDLTRIGRTSRSGDSTEATVAPVYVPGDDPLVLSASHGGDLVAFAAAAGADVRWRFRSGGTIYGTPTVDDEHGRIFFGSTDKRLYAIDRNGFFLWSVLTGDSVATRPLLVDDMVVFGSEDRRVYAVDAASGDRRWSVDMADAVVSSPAVADGVVAIGSDSGAVVGIDAGSGREVWQYDMGAAVEAPVAVARDMFIVGGSDGVVAALDPATGEEQWTAELDAGVRAAPVVAGETVVVVDTSEAQIHALRLSDGSLAWSSAQGGYVGPAGVAGSAVVAARDDGAVHELDAATGEQQRSWDAAQSAGSSDRAPSFDLGMSAGGGALWLADADSVVRRLGGGEGATQGPAPLAPAWFKTFSDAPYAGTFDTPLGTSGEQAILVDGSGSTYAVDPATGDAEQLGSVQAERGVFTGPVVADERLFVVAGGTVYARSLPGVEPLWQYQTKGNALQRPVVVGDLLYYATTPDGDENTVTATVHAVDVATGQPRWTAEVDGVGAGIGVSAEDGRVFAGGAAFDAATGEQLWRHDFGSQAAVSGTASVDGVHYVTALDPVSNESSLTALTAEGDVVWTTATDDVLSVLAAPQIGEDVVVLATLGGQLAAYDRATGEHRWDWEGSAGMLGSALLYQGQVWAATTDAHVTVVDAATGAEVADFAEVDFELEPFASLQQPTGIGNQVVVPLGAMLIGFDIPGGQ